MAIDRIVDRARRSVAVAREADLGLLSAAVAYYALVSVFPLALLALVAASTVGEAAADRVARTIAAGAAPSLRPMLLEAVATGGATQGTATVVGLGLLAWSASRIFAGVDRALRQIHGVGSRWGRMARPVAALVVLGSVAIVSATLAAVSLVSAVVSLPFEGIVTSATTVVAVALGLLPLYVVLSSDGIGLAEAWPGAVVAAVALAALRAGFEFYVTRTGAGALYGIVGGVLLFALWLYLGGAVVLFGACVNQAGVDADAGTPT